MEVDLKILRIHSQAVWCSNLYYFCSKRVGLRKGISTESQKISRLETHLCVESPSDYCRFCKFEILRPVWEFKILKGETQPWRWTAGLLLWPGLQRRASGTRLPTLYWAPSPKRGTGPRHPVRDPPSQGLLPLGLLRHQGIWP